MNQISDPPNINTAGLEFDYNVWAPNTQITLTNIPLASDYMHVLSPTKVGEINRLIDDQVGNMVYTNSKHAPIDRPIVLDAPYAILSRFNYVRVYNPKQPNDLGEDRPQYFYYFINDVVQHAVNSTSLMVQLDAWTTYVRQVRFGRAFIERGHYGIANENAFTGNGRVYLTEGEGLDTGVDHNVAYMGGDYPIMRFGDQSILVTASQALEKNAGSINDPIINKSEAQISSGQLSGMSQYLFPTTGDFIGFLQTRGNQAHLIDSIISVVSIPKYTRYWTAAQLGARLSIGAYKMPEAAPRKLRTVEFANWRKYVMEHVIPKRYEHLKKFLTYPYTYVYLSNKQGQTVTLRPELIAGDDLVYFEEAALSGTSQRVQWVVDGYNSKTISGPNGGLQGLGADYAVNISDFPQSAITVDGGLLALSRSAHSLAFASQQANWNLRKGLEANDVAAYMATQSSQMGTDLLNGDLGNQKRALGLSQSQERERFMLDAASNVLSATAGGAIGGPAGMVGAAATSAAAEGVNAIKLNQAQGHQNQQYNLAASSARGQNDISTGYANAIRDTNKTYGDWATRGDYEQQIASLAASKADMMSSPPSIAGQQGGADINFINWRLGFDMQIRVVDEGHLNLIGEYWLRYGYAINRYAQIPNELQVMTHFTYWKVSDLAIQGNIPHKFLNTLRGIVEKGVTIVENPFDVGFIDPGVNKPLKGFALGEAVAPPTIPDPPIEPPISTKRKRKRMLVYSTVSSNPATPGNMWALAGTSPGTDANWIVTRDGALANQYLEATGQTDPVGLDETTFLEYQNVYRGPVSTLEFQTTEGAA